MKVSVCIPTYNNPEEVTRLLDSLEIQTYQDFEVCISDDSTDDRVEKAAAGREKVRYRHNEKPLGHIYNWNAAMRMGAGEYIKIMFSDDWFTDADSLASFVKMLDENPDCDFGFCASVQVPERSAAEGGRDPYIRTPDSTYIQQLRENYRTVFMSNQIGAPSDVILRNAVRNEYFFDERSNWASDVFLYMRVLSVNPRFVYTERPLISIGMHDAQYTHTFEEYDARKLGDYALLYKLYDLKKDPSCRTYFAQYARENRVNRYKRRIKKLLGMLPEES